jgi:transcriptional regulator with XRE-family HTH domain
MTLEQMRQESGLSIQGVLDAVRTIAPDAAPTARSGIIHWERRGTDSIRVIRALAQVYGRPLEEVEAAALDAHQQYRAAKHF